MKTSGACPKCRGTSVVHLPVVNDAGDWFGDGEGPASKRTGGHPVPRALGLVFKKASGGLFSSDSYAPAAETEAFVCTACGYVEEYVKSAASVPWGDVVGARRR